MTSKISVAEALASACEIAGEIVRGERHPLDGCRMIAEVWAVSGQPVALEEFARLADMYEFHLDQPRIIKSIHELAEQFLESELE
ncbi:MAG: hypothetical protein KDD69_09690 [Bdellovibrionales bacterium]|nr:hypothetical protein [Bdellovibrionales bacterium]